MRIGDTVERSWNWMLFQPSITIFPYTCWKPVPVTLKWTKPFPASVSLSGVHNHIHKFSSIFAWQNSSGLSGFCKLKIINWFLASKTSVKLRFTDLWYHPILKCESICSPCRGEIKESTKVKTWQLKNIGSWSLLGGISSHVHSSMYIGPFYQPFFVRLWTFQRR